MSVLIVGKVGIMLKLLYLELQLCQGPLIFFKEGLDVIIIGINNYQLILKFFQLCAIDLLLSSRLIVFKCNFVCLSENALNK